MSSTRIIWPIIILLVGISIALGLIFIRPEQRPSAPPDESPALQVIRAVAQTYTPDVRSQGVVMPRTEIDLTVEVTGRITGLHPAFISGDIFRKGDVLVTVDPRDYDHAIIKAQAEVAQAKHRLAVEEEEATQAHYEWEVLGGDKPATPLMLRVPQLADARARLKAAESDLAQARLQRNRCNWRAPFTGRIRSHSAGLGLFVRPGDGVARLYATDRFEVRLPLSLDQLNVIGWPTGQSNAPDPTAKQSSQINPIVNTRPKAGLTAPFGDTIQHWQGHIVRIEGAFSESTGLLHAVVEIDPTQEEQTKAFPLLPGLFVQAEIAARPQPGLFQLPREALSGDRSIALIDAEGVLRNQPVRLHQIETDHAWISAGIETGSLIVTPAPSKMLIDSKPRYQIIDTGTMP